MFSGETVKGREHQESDEESERAYPRGQSPNPVTPKMLIGALKRLQEKSFKGLLFTSRDVAQEILQTHPDVEQDPQVLLLEVSDKLSCAAAAGLVGTVQDLGYFYFNIRQSETRSNSASELMFWIFYKKILKKKADERQFEKQGAEPERKKEKLRGKKTLRLMAFAGDHLHVLPLTKYRRKLVEKH